MRKLKITLAGNPNVGKSSIFNILTKENQHTGNWIGKTVETKKGEFIHNNNKYEIYDLPGTYSININSKEEEVARDAIIFDNYDLIVIVIDSTSFERNLNLVFQILEYTNKVLLCINLIDEAEKIGIDIDTDRLSKILNINTVKTSARKKIGIDELKDKIELSINNKYDNKFIIKYNEKIEEGIKLIEEEIECDYNKRWISIKMLENDKNLITKLKNKYNIKNINKIDIIKKEIEQDKTIDEQIIDSYYKLEKDISKKVLTKKHDKTLKYRDKIDEILTNKLTGIPIMFLLVMLIFYITIVFANYPSSLLFDMFNFFEDKLLLLFNYINIPDIITLPLINGVYKTLTWVVSVMLPPMAIFFPLFSLLEDLGYLPRIAFNLDGVFAGVNTCGKQSLTMMMGFGCNAVGVTNARIIDNKKQRLIAILTNNFVPCNGRFPMIISIITMFLATNSFIKTSYLLMFIMLSFIVTLLVSYVLSKTILINEESSFTLELPPYRKPNIIKTIIRSFKDKTLKVLKRAVAVSIPAGLIIYLFANTNIGNITILNYINNFLDPLGQLIGLDGVILTGFLLGFPANEIVIPIIIMTYMNTGVITDIDNLNILKELFVNNGWTYKTAICTIIFSLLHFPCSTTLITIYKETKSKLWTIISFILPLLIAITFCLLINLLL